MRIVAKIVWVIVALGVILYGSAHKNWLWYKETYLNLQRQPIYGLYEVETFTRDGKVAPPLLTDTTRWHWLYFGVNGAMRIVFMHDTGTTYRANQDAAKNTVSISSNQATNVFTYSWGDTNHIVLRGSMAGDALEVRLHEIASSNFLLLNRGFHWINEYPFF